MKSTGEKCPLSSQQTLLTFSLLSDWPEKCCTPLAAVFSRCFLLPPPGQVKTLFPLLKKYTLARKQAFIFNKTEKKNETTGY